MKRFGLFLITVFMIVLMCGCSEKPENAWAIIMLSDGTVIEGNASKITRWNDSNYAIEIGGVVYKVHPLNLTLIYD